MKLTESHIAKIDPLLEEELIRAEGNERLRVAMAIGSDKANQSGEDHSQKPHPSDFNSPRAYRQALIDRQRNQLARELDTTIQALKDLSLEIYGGTTSRIVVVEGTAYQIFSSLDLPGVRSASLDQTIRRIENIPVEVVQGLADIAIEIFKQGKSGIQNWFGQGVARRTEEAIVRAAQQYIQEYKNKYSNLPILGTQEVMNLESVYTTVKFSKYKRLLREDLGMFYPDSDKQGFRRINKEKQTGINVAQEEQYLLVLGTPGSGKSVFLRKIGLEILKGKQEKFQHSCIPVLIELKKFPAKEIDLPAIIVQEFKSCGFPQVEEFTQKALEQGRLLILLDGVDEVTYDKRQQVTEAIDEATKRIEHFVGQYHRNRFIISYRVAAYRYLQGFTTVEIADFDNKQIEEFIDNWFYSAKDQQAGTAQKCKELLKEPGSKAARELAQNPLLLTFLCLVYDHSQRFAKNRSFLYDKALRIFLEEWSAQKRTHRDQVFQQLGEREKILLSQIAWNGLKSNRIFFDKSELLQNIEVFLEKYLSIPQNLTSEAVFNAITVQQGIWTERAENVYSFSHLTLQEYLTADYICKERQVKYLVEERLLDERWREVFLLVAGLINERETNELLLNMNKKIGKATTRPNKLKTLLQWVNEKTANSGGDTHPMVKRATVLISVLDFIRIQTQDQVIEQKLNRALYFVRNFAYSPQLPPDLDLAKELTRALDLAVDCSRSRKLASDRTHSQDLRSHIKCALNLAHNLYRELERDRRKRVTIAQKHLHHRNSQPPPSPKEMFARPNLSKLADRLETLLSQFPDTEQPPAAYQKFAHSLGQICLEFFKLEQNILEISQKDAAFIEKYLYANDLMVQCSEEGKLVLKQIWKKIQNQMLTPC
ncbi:MAG: NACHT domain-containing protein [Symploca sp. SIO2G7]|nr:NACHT domain-containing protein [Symploca sp. SIO2G7]